MAPDGALEARADAPRHALAVPPDRPQPVRGLVTELDRHGRYTLGLLAQGAGVWVAVAFTCELDAGVVEVDGVEAIEREPALAYLEDRILSAPVDVYDGRPELALGLLRAALFESRRADLEALGAWVARCAGVDLHPAPLLACFACDELEAGPLTRDDARELLEALPDWWEEDPLTFELASAAVLRGSEASLDTGAIRVLFERRLVARIANYRQMLIWMGVYWYVSGEPGYSRLALTFARELGDPQNAVPRNPWIDEYARRSLRRAATSQRGPG